MKRQQDIQRILEEFKGVRNIPGIKTAKKKVLITKIKKDKGECITSRKGIADVFGEFYKRLYEDKERDDFEHEMSDDRRIPEITTEELQNAISKIKKRQIPRQQWNSCRRHQSLLRRDERGGETTLQRDHKEEQLHT